MTKPISEPTPALESANYGWRIRQLERRPAPEPGRLPWAMIVWEGFDTPFTATTGVQYAFGALPAFTSGVVGAAGAGVFTPDLVNGTIPWSGSDTAFMHAQATVQWGSQFAQQVVTWVFIGAAILGEQFFPSIANGSVAGSQLPAAGMAYVANESSYATGYFQQDSGSNKNLIRASVSIYRVDDADDAVGV